MVFRLLPAVLLLLLSSLCFCQDQVQIPEGCPVTKPSDRPFIPPARYVRRLTKDDFWYGTDRLWTILPGAGAWVGLPHFTQNDPTFRQKLFFWTQGFDPHAAQQIRLFVSGGRLDSPAPPMLTDGLGNPSWTSNDEFLVTGVNFPTSGCWKITAKYGDSDLTFVIWIEGR